MIKILSIDGGGIRGIIPAILLAEIEKRTGKPISKLFDLIAGTSTGGILALGLVKPNTTSSPQYSAERLVALYEKEGSKIFSRTFLHKVLSIDSLISEKYTSEGIEFILKKYFDDTPISKALTDVIITSYETEGRSAWFFKSRDIKSQKKGNQDFLMWKVARATSAAPTYFEPAKIHDKLNNKSFSFIDGGVFASNPSMCAYVEGKSIYSKDEDFLVLSLGTGERSTPLLYNDLKNWGLVNWAQPLLGVVFDGINDTVDYQLRQLLPSKNGFNRYYRFQTRLDKKNDEMDDASKSNIEDLKRLAYELIIKNNWLIATLCKQLV